MLNFCGVFDRIKTASVAKTLQSSPTTCPPAGFLGLDSSILGSFGSSSSSATQKATSAVQRRSPMGRSAWWVQKAGVWWLTMIIHKEQHYDYDSDNPIYIYIYTYIHIHYIYSMNIYKIYNILFTQTWQMPLRTTDNRFGHQSVCSGREKL